MGGAVGIVGGNGALGGAIAEGLLAAGAVAPGELWVSSRSGTGPGFAGAGALRVTSDNAELVAACDTVILSVPPAAAGGIGIRAEGRLVISVMAGVTLARLREIGGTGRVIRAMSSPAAALRLAYSPYCPGAGATVADAAEAARLLGAVGATDAVPDEDQIDRFTALTGPVPGFVAACAAAMAAHARKVGIEADVADRAVRQLFLAAGRLMAEGPGPEAAVQEMIDYAGTTAAGLAVLRDGPFAEALDAALEAAYRRAKAIG